MGRYESGRRLAWTDWLTVSQLKRITVITLMVRRQCDFCTLQTDANQDLLYTFVRNFNTSFCHNQTYPPIFQTIDNFGTRIDRKFEVQHHRK